MRELKFRVWFKDHCDPTIYTEYDFFDDTWTDSEYIAIDQYTGLKDKNGKEIYEGDIILEKWFDEEAHWGEDRVGKCEYFKGSFVCWFAGGRMIPLGMFPVNNIEVIGNIHENLELLEKDEQCPSDHLM